MRLCMCAPTWSSRRVLLATSRCGWRSQFASLRCELWAARSWPVLCVGGITAGTPLEKLCRHIYEIVTYQNYSTDDSLNPVAAIRLRDEPEVLDQLPAPPRLVRRPLSLDFTATA